MRGVAVGLLLWVLPLPGAAIVFVVVNLVGITSVFRLPTQETVGVVAGADLFALLSGAVLGMAHGSRAKDDLGTVVDRTASRAWKLYVTALIVGLAALARGRAWLVLAISLGLCAAGTVFRIRLLPSRFEDSFPLLVWQVLFVIGMTAGHHRRQIVAWFSHRRRRPALAACLVPAVACALFAWSSPYLTSAAYVVVLGLLWVMVRTRFLFRLVPRVTAQA